LLIYLNIIGVSSDLIILSEFPVYAGEKWESMLIQEKGYFPSAPVIRLYMSELSPYALEESRNKV